MRITKYVVITASIVAILAAIAWFLRDYLIERVSNPLLAEYGITVTDVSLDALATDDASISYLELVHEKGTTIAIENLTLPISARSDPRTFTASRVSVITATRSDGALVEVAELIRQFLSLPDTLANSAVRVAEFSVADYPTVRDVQWDIREDEQHLRGTVESISMSLQTTRKDAAEHTVAFSVAPGSAPAPGRAIVAALQLGDENISLMGASSIDLPHWAPLASLAGIIPSDVELVSGTARLDFAANVPVDATQTPTLSASLAPTSSLQLGFTTSPGDSATIVVESADALEIAATFPGLDWSLQLQAASLVVSYGDWQKIPLSLSRVSCLAEPACSMTAKVSIDDAALPIGRVRQLKLASTATVSFPETGPHVDVQPGATLGLSGLRTAAGTANRIEGKFASGATLSLVEAGWRFTNESLDLEIETMALSDEIAVSMPMYLETILASELDGALAFNAGVYTPSMQAYVGERRLALPGFKGKAAVEGSELGVDLSTVGLHREGTISATHYLDTRIGKVELENAVVSFDSVNLSSRVSPWSVKSDLVSGTVSLEFSARWKPDNSRLAINAQAALDAAELAGYYEDTAFTGGSTQITASYQDGTGFTTERSSVSVALVETGLPVEDLSADYLLDLNAMSVDVENLSMSAVGGVINADPFSFHTDGDSNTLTLRAESIDLSELLSLQELEAIEVSGSVGATLPVTIEDGTVTIVNGSLTGEPAGGVIRYTPGTPSDLSDTSSIGFATRVLSNFEFDTLTSDVNLTRDGDLNLKLKLTGRNPDLDEKRPVVLNLGVENNIPQMLRSLRAARAVEEVLEQRLGK